MEFRRVFDLIPESFDKYRPRYNQECFDYIFAITGLNETSDVLEIGPGTGQATSYLINHGVNYCGIEIGINLCQFICTKYKKQEKFSLINNDFITFTFDQKYDMVFSAATIQWIPEIIAYTKSYDILKDNGYLVMIMTKSNYENRNKKLFDEIQEVYKKYFHPETPYTQRFNYYNGVNYGFEYIGYNEFQNVRILNSDDFINYSKTHCDHITLKEPLKSLFYEGLKKAIMNNNNKIIIDDLIKVFILKKIKNNTN